MANISKWFGNSIYINSIKNFEQINKKIVPIIEKDLIPSNSKYSKTTDIKSKELQSIDDNLHLDKRFNDLFKEIANEVNECLLAQKYNLDLFDVFFTKSWATLSIKDQFISFHKHMSSHLSFVYYPKAHDQGNLFFIDDDASKLGLTVPKRDPYFTEWNKTNYGKSEYPAETGNIIIFPSMLFHETGKNEKKETRISISGDIMLTMKKGIKSEHNIPSPSTWKKL